VAHPALLLTDVVDSTALNQRLGDARMAELWTAHDRVARDLLATHGGRELGRTDGFLMTFDDPLDAVRYARAYHAALAPLGMQARAGLHVGPLTVRKNPDVDVARGAKPDETAGFAISVAARVMSIAGPGQTLASAEAVDELEDRIDRFVVVSHGHWQLKGVLDPLEVFEVGVRGEAPFAPPKDAEKAWRVQWSSTTWIPMREMRHRLPAERDAFVGRRDDLVDLVARVDAGARLVSLLGIGGTGKTRLALRYGWITLGSWPGGAWFCDLSDARDVNGIAYAVATALDVPLGKADPIAHLGNAIAGRGRCLLILDNFEQVAGCAAETLGRWLDAAPAATFVATTREVLRLPGEVALDLAPLGAGDAIALFDARASAADRRYVANPEAVTRLVDMLDGLPLAIELAAARVRLMPLERLIDRMRDRFALLASSGGRVDRHATLRATIDWSWHLLSDDERRALGQLSVFEGGFALDAAEAVVSTSVWAADAIQALVDKSLVRGGARLQQLVSVQAYASEKLDEMGGRADAELRHGVYFAKFGTDEALVANEGRKTSLAAELENMTVAARRAIARRDRKVARCAALGSWKVLRNRGPLAAGLALLRSALELEGHDLLSRGALELGVGIASRRLGRLGDARIAFDHVLEVANRAADPRLEGRARYEIGTLVHQMGEDQEAHDQYVAALSLARAAGDKRTEARTLNGLAAMDALAGRSDEAFEQFRVALEAARGDVTTEVNVMCNMGDLHYERGRIEQACELYEAARALAREHGELRVSEATSLVRLGTSLNVLGDRRARATLEEALSTIRAIGYAYGLPNCLAALSLLDTDDGHHDLALARLHEALELVAPYPDELADVLVAAAQVHLARGSIAEARAAVTRARALGHVGRVGAFIAACDALVAVAEGHFAAATTAIAEAESDPDLCAPGSEVARLVTRAREGLPGIAR
jgi:predicted ATPase/class 3 adenylate cyclase